MVLSTFILSSVALLITLYASQYRDEDLKKTLTELKEDLGLPRIKSYDIIIVGAGSSGCVLASRLSEHLSVLLLEKGGPPPPLVNNPLDFNDVVSHHDINDAWSSVKQTQIKGESAGINTVTSGRMLGGSGSHNTNIYCRGSPKDYDTYAGLFNDSSWDFNSTLQYFRRMENVIGPLVDESDRDQFYGSDGPIAVESKNPAIIPLWFQAGRELGYQVCDPQIRNAECFTYMMKSTHNGVRSSSYTGYLEPIIKAKSRSKLTVLTYSDVDQVLINAETKEAYGVTYRRHGVAQIAHAKREVILSAGTYVSPIILIKSGIGPVHGLKNSKIPLVFNVPGVGHNLRTHAGVWLDFVVRNTSEVYFPTVSESEIEEQLDLFQKDWRSGFFSGKSFAQAQAFFVSQQAKLAGQEDHPDIQFLFKQTPRIGGDTAGPQKLQLLVGVNRLLSVGEVSFNHSAYLKGERDPVKLAIVDYKMLEHHRDRKVVLEGIHIAVRLMEETTAFQPLKIEFDVEAAPKACGNTTLKSDAYWKFVIQQRGGTPKGHQVGTCRMGVLDTDELAVVDPKFRVRGVKNLRVVDASVFPFPINANINAAVLMIAEKAVDDILNEK